jgi:hypothetical protein
MTPRQVSFLDVVKYWLGKRGVRRVDQVISVDSEHIQSGYCETCADSYEDVIITYQDETTATQTYVLHDVYLTSFVKELTDLKWVDDDEEGFPWQPTP